MIAKSKASSALLGGAVLLAGCVQSPPAMYQRAYQPPQAYYSAPYGARPAPRSYALPETVPAKPSLLKPETETARRETAPPRGSSSPSADDCVGWWRICHFL
jgi:hypothetical protein